MGGAIVLQPEGCGFDSDLGDRLFKTESWYKRIKKTIKGTQRGGNCSASFRA